MKIPLHTQSPAQGHWCLEQSQKGIGGNANTINPGAPSSSIVGSGNIINSNSGGSVAIGNNNLLSAASSFAFGAGNQVTGTGSFAIGTNNTIPAGCSNVFIVGTGITGTSASIQNNHLHINGLVANAISSAASGPFPPGTVFKNPLGAPLPFLPLPSTQILWIM